MTNQQCQRIWKVGNGDPYVCEILREAADAFAAEEIARGALKEKDRARAVDIYCRGFLDESF